MILFLVFLKMGLKEEEKEVFLAFPFGDADVETKLD
jgi:hypothetical protein